MGLRLFGGLDIVWGQDLPLIGLNPSRATAGGAGTQYQADGQTREQGIVGNLHGGTGYCGI